MALMERPATFWLPKAQHLLPCGQTQHPLQLARRQTLQAALQVRFPINPVRELQRSLPMERLGKF